MSFILHLPESAQSLILYCLDKRRMLKLEQLSWTQRNLKDVLETKEKERAQKDQIRPM